MPQRGQPGSATALPRLNTAPAGRSLSTSSLTSTPSTPMPSRQWASQRPADPGRSLYHVCACILAELAAVPQLAEYVEACAQQTPAAGIPQINLGVAPRGLPLDPVSQLWRVLRLGVPLCLLFNASKPQHPLEIPSVESCGEIRAVKHILYRFLEACMHELGLRPEEELFTISNVLSDSTSDLLKVLRTTRHILDLLAAKDILPQQVPPPQPPPGHSQRDRVVCELVATEQKYVQDLELLAEFHDALLAANIPRETVQKMFPYLSSLVDFQRRFLVGLEYHARLPEQDQQFGSLFLLLADEFAVYEGYTLNQKEASDLVLHEAHTLAPFSHIIEPTHELPSLLLKPVQRICKYPLLLRELSKHTPREWAASASLDAGLDIINAITSTVNETQRKIENSYILSDLKERIKDWRGLVIDRMGDLLLSGFFPIATLDIDSEYHLYLFEAILLCCKDGVQHKKSITKMRSRQSKRFSLELKGRIYISYVTTVKLVQPNSLRILWGKGDAAETGTFEIKFANEEQALLWESTLARLVSSNTAVPEEEVTAPFYDDMPTPASLSPVESRLRNLSISSLTNDDHRQRSTSDIATRTFSQSSATLVSQEDSQVHPLYGRVPISAPPVPTTKFGELSATRSTSAQFSLSPRSASVSATNSLGSKNLRVRINSGVDSALVVVPANTSYEQLASRVQRKLRLCGKTVPTPLKMKYKDEDDDFVSLDSDEDLEMALECAEDGQLVLWIP